jgi:NADP-dependent alcohol dehydrogenase
VIFGKGTIADIPKYILPLARILMIYGQGSIKKNGVYDQVKDALKNFTVLEFGGIESNPRYETCMKAVELVKESSIDFLLSVGGGSVLDATKFIALAPFHTASDDPWDFMVGRQPPPHTALPVGCIMTVPASGSELNSGLVISRESTQEKIGYSSFYVYPKFSVLDPETTYSLPINQVVNGVIDSFVHVLEQYITYPSYTPVQDRQAEALLATIIEESRKVFIEPGNYNIRATLMWCAAQALNGIISRGTGQDWSTHLIAQEITAFYGLDHAATLAIILIGVWENQFENKKSKLAQYGRRIWNLQGDDNSVARGAIEKTEDFFNSLNVLTRISHYGLDANVVAEKICRRFLKRGINAMGEQQAVNIENIWTIIISRA